MVILVDSSCVTVSVAYMVLVFWLVHHGSNRSTHCRTEAPTTSNVTGYVCYVKPQQITQGHDVVHYDPFFKSTEYGDCFKRENTQKQAIIPPLAWEKKKEE